MKGNDHKCSLNPEEFAEMVKSIRMIELSLGTPHKMFQSCEEECFKKLGKSLVASKNLEKGRKINAEDILIKVNKRIAHPLRRQIKKISRYKIIYCL